MAIADLDMADPDCGTVSLPGPTTIAFDARSLDGNFDVDIVYRIASAGFCYADDTREDTLPGETIRSIGRTISHEVQLKRCGTSTKTKIQIDVELTHTDTRATEEKSCRVTISDG